MPLFHTNKRHTHLDTSRSDSNVPDAINRQDRWLPPIISKSPPTISSQDRVVLIASYSSPLTMICSHLDVNPTVLHLAWYFFYCRGSLSIIDTGKQDICRRFVSSREHTMSPMVYLFPGKCMNYMGVGVLILRCRWPRHAPLRGRALKIRTVAIFDIFICTSVCER